MSDQKDCVLNVLEELGDTQLFLKKQYSTGIFSFFLLLLPSMLSTCYQTNEGNARNISEYFLYFSRIERLNLLFDIHVVNDEEDTLSSILHNRRKNISLVQHQSQVLFPTRTVLGEEPAGSLLCCFALTFDRHAKSFASNFNVYYSSWTSGSSCSLLFKFITNLFDRWEILTKEWVLSLFANQILISTPYLPCK